MAESENLWEKLGRPRFVVAPMVDASELAWRMLSRAHKAQLCYSPMYHSSVFTKDPRYRKEALATCPEDRPLIIQFCGNKADVLVEAAKLAEPYCDAIDINLGCPQAIAKRGHYGAFLQDDWELLSEIVSTMSKELTVPVTCKVRVFESIPQTVAYAKMLESAGCKMLTVHGRTREQKGPLTGIASWKHIKAVRENVNIPVLANGNIQNLVDLEHCLEETGCNGVMSAEGNLYNPFLFEGANPPSWEPALEYLDLVERFPCPTSYIRGHLFKIFQQLLSLKDNAELREEMAKGSKLEDFRNTVLKLKDKYIQFHEGTQIWTEEKTDCNLHLPPWLCQPYVRMAPEEHIKKMEELNKKSNPQFDLEKENLNGTDFVKRKRDSSAEQGLSKKKLKKLQRHPGANPHSRRVFEKCSLCPNPVGLKCEYALCRICCRNKCHSEEMNCPGHRISSRAQRERARELASEKDSNCNVMWPACLNQLQKYVEGYHKKGFVRIAMGDNDKKTEPNDENEDSKWGYDLFPERTGRFSPTLSRVLSGFEGKEEMDKMKCERNVYNCFKKSKLVQIMLGALRASGCEIDLRRHVVCEVCDSSVSGGYDPKLNQIVVCQNNCRSEGLVQGVLTHEMIHMFDYCKHNLDFKNIEHLACTEIRAANLAHCSFMSALLQGDVSPSNIKNRHQECVKSKAIKSVLAVRNVTYYEAKAAVDRVFSRCYADLEPIGRRIKPNSTDTNRAYAEGYLYGYV